MPKKPLKINISKDKLRPKERAPIMPSRTIEDKRKKLDRKPKHKKDPRLTE
jgi:hypothetical protein